MSSSPIRWIPHVDKYASRESARINRASYLRDDGTGVFFADFAFAPIKDAELLQPPVTIAERWPHLLRAGFSRIDAILPDSKLSDTHRLCIFRGENYAQIDEFSGQVLRGPEKVQEAWPSLREAGFVTVDAALPHPASSNKATFFKGTEYALVTFEMDGDGLRTELLQKGTIASRWPSLASFPSIDSVLVEPSDRTKANFFSGSNYVCAEIEPSKTVEASRPTPRGGNRTISLVAAVEQPLAVADRWPALKKAGFY